MFAVLRMNGGKSISQSQALFIGSTTCKEWSEPTAVWNFKQQTENGTWIIVAQKFEDSMMHYVARLVSLG